MKEQSRIEATILRLTAECGRDRSICPTEVARALDPVWRPLLTRVRRAAIGLARDGRIEIRRKGGLADPATVKGVIRLRMVVSPAADV
ncbi:MAG: DUF3253 domain-containing protein [Acetobacteraceae bacterium]|nr:DUF3253 domain-containing protein [Acetobacteraceae bacterium]